MLRKYSSSSKEDKTKLPGLAVILHVFELNKKVQFNDSYISITHAEAPHSFDGAIQLWILLWQIYNHKTLHMLMHLCCEHDEVCDLNGCMLLAVDSVAKYRSLESSLSLSLWSLDSLSCSVSIQAKCNIKKRYLSSRLLYAPPFVSISYPVTWLPETAHRLDAVSAGESSFVLMEGTFS